jgi:HlyD family secretion protein
MTKTLIGPQAVGAIIILGSVLGIVWWKGRPAPLPDGIIASNGRIEAELVDIAAGSPGRVKQMLAREGDAVEPGQVLVRMDEAELEAGLAKARADLARAELSVSQADVETIQLESDLKLAQQDLTRAVALAEKGSLPQRISDQRQNAQEAAGARLTAARKNRQAQGYLVQAARAEMERIQARIRDGTLSSPVRGRVLYRLAQPGEVLAAGGKALTVVNLEQIYLEVFLPAPQVGRIALGAEARILLDTDPGSPMPATITFISPSAQFTPKYVETASERDKLMFRVKAEVSQAYAAGHLDRIRPGVRGLAYIRLDSSQAWPAQLGGR